MMRKKILCTLLAAFCLGALVAVSAQEDMMEDPVWESIILTP